MPLRPKRSNLRDSSEEGTPVLQRAQPSAELAPETPIFKIRQVLLARLRFGFMGVQDSLSPPSLACCLSTLSACFVA